MMNKKDYIEAMNEIKANDKLKMKTIQKITQQKNRYYVTARRILSAAAVFVLLFSFAYINKDVEKEEEKEKINNIATIKLPTVDSYENMKKIYNENEKNSNNRLYKASTSINSSITDQVYETANSASKLSDYSTTNVQVQGVDEADIVKNNGEYIFYYRRVEGDIKVIDAKNNKVINSIKYDDIQPIEMYLKDDRLIVITTIESAKTSRTYSNKYVLKIFNYDISNMNDIKIVKEVETEGNLLQSRMIGDYVYIVSNKYIYSSMLEDEQLLKPTYRDSDIGDETKCIEYNEIQCFPEGTENVYMIVSSFNVKTNDPMNVQTYLGSGNDVYASVSNLYITSRSYTNTKSIIQFEYTDNTKVYKLSLNNGNVGYVADTIVPGYVKDQFSMDEYKGYLRIATTHNSKETGYKDINNLYVLDEKLNLVGQVENLAPEERIHSVRYMGDKAYMVTFEQVDPLFVIDLSDPMLPKVLGQLKIPGYSEYLHPYDETHLIGFGRDTETDGENVKENGFKMSLFDVSDMSNPKELYTVKIGDSGTYSELLYNHKALLFSKEKNIIAFPIVIRQKQNGSNYYSKTTFGGAVIYGLSLENGFEERAKISSDSEYASLDRIIYIGDKLYTLSEDAVKVVDMNTMKEIGKIAL